MNSSDVGAKIVKLRKEMGYTQATLAEALNVSNKTVSRWETGDGFPEITILPLLADELGTTIDWLLSSDVRTSGGTVETSNKSSSVPPIFIILLVYEIFNLLGEVIPKLLLEKKIFNQGMVLLGGIDFFIMMASISLSIAMLLKFRRTGQKKEYRLTVIWASLLISTNLYKMWIRAIYIGFINAHMVSADIISLRDFFVVTFSIKLLEAILMVLCGWGTFEVLENSAINKCNLLLLFSYIIVFGVTTIGIFAGKEMNNVLAVSMVSLIYVVSVIFILRGGKNMKKFLRKILSLGVVLGLCLSMFNLAYAETMDPFRAALEECNKKYNIQLTYIPISRSADLQKYKDFIESIAKDTRETLDYIKSIEPRKDVQGTYSIPRKASVVVKEKTKTVDAYYTSSTHGADRFKGTATYHIIQGNIITELKSFSAAYQNRISDMFGLTYTYSVTSYSTNFYDSGHTLGVSANGDLVGYDENFVRYEVGNVTTQYMYSDTY